MPKNYIAVIEYTEPSGEVSRVAVSLKGAGAILGNADLDPESRAKLLLLRHPMLGVVLSHVRRNDDEHYPVPKFVPE